VSYRVEILDKCEALFRTDGLFNDELIQIAKCYFDIKQLTLLKDGEIVCAVPVQKTAIGEWGFFGAILPFVDYRWFTDKIEHLKILEELSEERTPLDVVNMVVGDSVSPFQPDYGLALVKTAERGRIAENYTGKFKKNIRRAIRASEGLEYRPIKVTQTEMILNYWFDLYDNEKLPFCCSALYQWCRDGNLLTFGIFDGDRLVGADYLVFADLFGERVACGFLTPWLKEEKELQKKEVGNFAMVEACDKLHRLGIDYFSIGDMSYPYKKRWATRVVPTFVVGKGRWEKRGGRL
jgi:hypothetical protein